MRDRGASRHQTIGLLAAETPPEGFLRARVDFIGRAGSVWKPRALETLAFEKPCNTGPCPSFDAIGSLLLNVRWHLARPAGCVFSWAAPKIGSSSGMDFAPFEGSD